MQFPLWVEPMLATLTERRFSDNKWIYEPKFDGARCLIFKNRNDVKLYSRNKIVVNRQYPELFNAVRRLRVRDFVLDGEIVAFQGPIPSFSKLQQRMHVENPSEALRAAVPVYFYAFDLPYVGGYSLARLPLIERKAILEKVFAFKDPLRYTAHRLTMGEALYEAACRKGWEGLIAKRAESRYVAGRSSEWLKFKCLNMQELVIGGFTDPSGARKEFGAVLLGTYEGSKFIYAGKVGTGFDDAALRRIGPALRHLERSKSPFANSRLIPRSGVHWVEPKLVAQIAFSEWTGEGRLRHGRFLGLRNDKSPTDVVREKTAA